LFFFFFFFFFFFIFFFKKKFQILEKLYRERWGPEDGVGSIIISPTRELAGQLFDVLRSVGKHHNFSAGLLIGGRKDVGTEKERVHELNILVCTPGRLLQHMDETPNFECSQLQVIIIFFFLIFLFLFWHDHGRGPLF
jgi:ATP-dependent RNA helicase DDX10/DBP4